jgi:hypothetical protein
MESPNLSPRTAGTGHTALRDSGVYHMTTESCWMEILFISVPLPFLSTSKLSHGSTHLTPLTWDEGGWMSSTLPNAIANSGSLDFVIPGLFGF